jgi:hypothetical protein
MKRKQLSIALKNALLLGRKSKLSTNSNILIYKTILKPIWTYGIKLWGSTSTSNIEILERLQSKTLRILKDAPWYVPNETIRKSDQIPTVKKRDQPPLYPIQQAPQHTPHITDSKSSRTSKKKADCNDNCQQICPPDSYRIWIYIS